MKKSILIVFNTLYLTIGLWAFNLEPSVLSSSLTVTATIESDFNGADISCHGGSDGEIKFTVSGGTPPYTYIHNATITETDETCFDIDGLVAGTYNIIVMDDMGCTAQTGIQLMNPPALILSLSSTVDVDCHGEDTGAAAIEVTGGTGDIDIDWPSGGDDLIETDLTGGVYEVTVTDENFCSTTLEITINEPEELEVNTNQHEDISCFGLTDGEAFAEVQGGTSPYFYNWETGGTNATKTGLAEGTYEVTVTDSNNCTLIESVTIEEPDELIVSIDQVEDISCFGESDGEVSLDVDGGTGAYTYQWSNGGEEDSIEELEAGQYSVIITDENGCTTSTSITIIEPDPITANIIVLESIPCEENGMGMLEVIAEGGTEPLRFEWDDGQTSDLAEFSTPGIYSVTVVDDNNCSTVVNNTLEVDFSPEFENFPEKIFLENGLVGELHYLSDSEETILNWEIISTNNIDTNSPLYMTRGASTNPLTFTFALLENRAPGYVILEVFPQNSICIGPTVQTRICVSPDGKPVFVPEIFSPNDDGVNDEWEVVFPSTENPDNYMVRVYSKNGQKVYEANSMSEPWTAKGCPTGAYYYIIEDKVNNQQFRGAVSILR